MHHKRILAERSIRLLLSMTLSFLFLGICSNSYSQQKPLIDSVSKYLDVKGTITDSKGQAMQAASVIIKGSGLNTMTNEAGFFDFKQVKAGDIVVVTYAGYAAQELIITTENYLKLNIRLTERQAASLQEVVVVGYGTRKREEITGSIATVKGSDLSIAPVGNITNTLAGRLSGLVSLQTSGQPGFDQATLNVRGFGNPLVIVDGIEADFTTLDPNTVESVSILKDASASIYGSRAGNGVILVTTKRGTAQKPVITLNSSFTYQGITNMPKPVSAGKYAEMARESHLNAGNPENTAPFTAEQVEQFYDGTNPQYPNTSWYDVIFRDWAPQQQHNVSVRGGSDKVKYYGFLGVLNQETMIKAGGSGYRRYNFISNVDARISNEFTFVMNLNTNYGIKKYPWRGVSSNANSAWEDFWNTQPIYPETLPDPTKLSWAVGSNTGGAHIMTNRDVAGYNDYEDQNIYSTVSLNYDSKTIRGLSGKALFNYNQDYGTNKNFTRPLKFYTYDYNADVYTLAGSLGAQASLSQRDYRNRVLTGQFSLNYEKRVGLHQFSMLVLHELIDYYSNSLSASRQNFLTPAIEEIFGGSTEGMTNDGTTSEMGRKSYIGRFSYNYDTKYLLDLNIRSDASAKFPSKKRWGYFPGLSLGWRINKEKFMDRINLDELKLRASYGSAGNDNIGNFQYLSGFRVASTSSTGLTYLFGNTAQPGIVSLGLPNELLTWEKTKVYNAGIDFSVNKGKLYGVLDVFYRERTGILSTRINNFPSTFGAGLPPENLNSLNNRGFELKLGTASSKHFWSWDLSGNISWSRDKWMHYEEPTYTDPDDIRINKKSGNWTDVAFGYKSNGLFTSQKEIDELGFSQDNNPTTPNASLRPGDIRYEDSNGDGNLDWRDVVELGMGSTPHWMFGITANVKFRQFDLSALFQGAFGYYTNLGSLRPGSVYSDLVYDERWTPENNDAHALIPRLGGKGFDRTSDYNYKNASYLRLKTFAFGYTIAPSVTNKIGIQQVRAYVAGTNLLTFSGLNKYNVDPEAPSSRIGLYYPQQKTVSAGVIISL